MDVRFVISPAEGRLTLGRVYPKPEQRPTTDNTPLCRAGRVVSHLRLRNSSVVSCSSQYLIWKPSMLGLFCMCESLW